LGSLIGRKKILSISPNKTYEGLLGGIICTTIFMIIFNYIFIDLYDFNFFLIILSIIFLSFLGDIIESYFKRLSNIKNSSTLIPGHGGFLDRFDSFILVTYGIFFYKFLII
ncbi:phosphatidate cytidylyltransferase, partial [Alphaproteobacteria bacterium]|nr:phosphatidate cytidylyltransferase [Alphaproteobacteria bacterium]